MPEVSHSPTSERIEQFLTTEQFVLQTARAATIQEANQRANLFLTAVSSATIALAFLAQVTQMKQPFLLFFLILLPCLYFVGLVTFVRAVQVAIEDMVHARGMARIRHYYIEQAPSLRRYFVHAIHDDCQAVLIDKAMQPSHWQSFISTAGMVSTISSVIAGVLAGVIVRELISSAVGLALFLGACLFVVSMFVLRRYHVRTWTAAERAFPAVFPGSTPA